MADVSTTARGVRPNPTLMAKINSLRKPSIFRNFLWLGLDYFLIVAPTSYIFFSNTWWIWFLLPVSMIAAARGMRGLECLVHDASHWNFIVAKHPTQKNRSDILINLVAALPVFSTVQGYRSTHNDHHKYLGKDKDPDYLRHVELRLDDLDRSSAIFFSRDLLLRIVPYSFSWWQAIRTDLRTLLLSFLWHSIVISIASIALGLATAIFLWLLVFLVPFIVSLPILRFIGEAGEHEYEDGHEIVVKTYTNIGRLHQLIIHPHNDGLHTLHHLYPHVPHHNLPALDEAIRNEKLLPELEEQIMVRRSVLESH